LAVVVDVPSSTPRAPADAGPGTVREETSGDVGRLAPPDAVGVIRATAGSAPSLDAVDLLGGCARSPAALSDEFAWTAGCDATVVAISATGLL
jgi:hypothetical protein